MSNYKENALIDIEISLGELSIFKSFIKIIIFDSNNKKIYETELIENTLNLQLKKGLYTIRTEFNGTIKDQIVCFDEKNNKSKISIDKLYSSIPLEYNLYESYNENAINELPHKYQPNYKLYESSHEYYTAPSKYFSSISQLTYTNNEEKNDSYLFILLRFNSEQKFKKMDQKIENFNFTLLDSNNEVLLSLDKSNSIIDTNNGFLIFSSKLPNGLYFLKYNAEKSRAVTLYLFKDWQTQIFITLDKKPLFGTTRILLSKNTDFNPSDISNIYIDILLDKLQNKDYSLSKELIEISAYNKFESPMLGLICSYIYLLGKEHNYDDLFQEIIKNLQNSILRDNENSADLLAIKILASKHFNTKPLNKNFNLTNVPILRVGFETIRDFYIQNEIILPYNYNDYISENLYFDSPFTSFRANNIEKLSYYHKNIIVNYYHNIKYTSFLFDNKIFKNTHIIDFFDKSKLEEIKSNSKQVENIFSIKSESTVDSKDFKMNIKQNLKYLDTNKIKNDSWVKNYILNEIVNDRNPTIVELSKELNITIATIYMNLMEINSYI